MKYNINILNQFDGTHNYFNCTGLNGKLLFRKQKKYKYKGQFLVSDIVDDNDNIVLESYETDTTIISYEDPRFINDNKISMCECIVDKFNPLLVINVKFCTYDLLTKEKTYFKTQNTHFEKHWQFYEDKIIYHISPFTLLDYNENVIYKDDLNFSDWIRLYGNPRLSTNVFEVNDIKYLLFHSCIHKQHSYLKYYIGLLKFDNELRPIGYFINPIIDCEKECIQDDTLMNMRKWRDGVKYHYSCYYDVIFPMNIEVNEYIKIYGGFNDCKAGYIELTYDEFNEYINNSQFILL